MTTVPVDTTYLVPGQVIDASDVTIPIYDVKLGAEGMIDGLYNFVKTVWQASVTATIAGGVLPAPTKTLTRLIPESAAPDDLDTITHVAATPDFLVLTNDTPAVAITLKHNTGNLWFDDGVDKVLSSTTRSTIVMYWNTVISKWASLAEFSGSVKLDNVVDKTIATDAITADATKIRLTAESGSTDNLSSIALALGINAIILTPVSGHTITLKHNVGNLFFPSGKDTTLTSVNDLAILLYNETINKWVGLVTTADSQVAAKIPSGTVAKVDVLELPVKSQLAGENPPNIFWRRRRNKGVEIWDEVAGSPTLATSGPAFTTVASAVVAAQDANSDWVQMTDSGGGAPAIGSVIHRRSDPVTQLRWNPYFEVTCRGYSNLQGASTIDHGGIVGMSNSVPAVTTNAGITVWTGIYGIFFTYQILNSGTGARCLRLVGVDNGVVTILATGVTITTAFASPTTWGQEPWWLAFNADANRIYYNAAGNLVGDVAYTPSPTMLTTALGCRIIDYTRAAANATFIYRHQAMSWKVS